MYSSPVTVGSPATAQQYNKLREDARWASYLLAHESATPNMNVSVESGYFYDNTGAKVSFAWGVAMINAVWANPRIDLISISQAWALTKTEWTASPSPVEPTLPSNHAPVAFVYLRVGGTSVKSIDDTVNHYIVDARTYITAPAQAISSTDSVPEWATNKYFTEARVRSSLLTGISTTVNAVITAADNILGALGKLQKQITDLTTTVGTKAPTANPTFTWTVSGITKAMVWLGSVDNTADSAKPVSTAQQTALNWKANLNGWNSFTGTQAFTWTGKMVIIGDDASLHDVNQANTVMLAGEQDSTQGKMLLGSGGAYVQGNSDGTLSLGGYSFLPWEVTATVAETIPSGIQAVTYLPSTTLIEYGTYNAIPNTMNTSPYTVNSVTYTSTQTDPSFPTWRAFDWNTGTQIASNYSGQNYFTMQMSASITSNKFYAQWATGSAITVEVSTNGSSWEAVWTIPWGTSFYGWMYVTFTSGYRTFSWFRFNFIRSGSESIGEFNFQKCELKTAWVYLAKATAWVLADFSGFVVWPKSIWNTVKFGWTQGTVISGFSGLTTGATYYISDTAGALWTTLWTVKFPVGRALDANRIILQKTESDKEKFLGQATSNAASFYHYGWLIWLNYPSGSNGITTTITGQKTITINHPYSTAGWTLSVNRISVDLPKGSYTATVSNPSFYVDFYN